MEKRTCLLEEMAWPEAEEALKAAEIALVPVGSLEQHGPHLGMAADTVSSYEFCKRLAERVYPKAVVTAAIPFGVSAHHLAFAGTVSIRGQTLIALAEEIALSLKHHGLGRVLFVNGHGGNRDALGVAATNLRFEHGVRAAHVLWPALGFAEGMQAASSKRVGHSCELEVSEMLHLKPELVKSDRLTEGQFIDAPLRHTSPRGWSCPGRSTRSRPTVPSRGRPRRGPSWARSSSRPP